MVIGSALGLLFEVQVLFNHLIETRPRSAQPSFPNDALGTDYRCQAYKLGVATFLHAVVNTSPVNDFAYLGPSMSSRSSRTGLALRKISSRKRSTRGSRCLREEETRSRCSRVDGIGVGVGGRGGRGGGIAPTLLTDAYLLPGIYFYCPSICCMHCYL